MSDQRYSIWHMLGLLAIVAAVAVAMLGTGLFLGYQWGQARGLAAVKREAAAEASGRIPQGLPGLPFDPEALPAPLVDQPYLGVRFEPVTPQLAEAEDLPVETGALIRAVEPGSPAAAAGLQIGDIVQAVNEAPVDQTHSLRDRLLAFEPGAEVTLEVLRADTGEAEAVEVTLGRRMATGFSFPLGEVGPGSRFELRCGPGPCPYWPELLPEEWPWQLDPGAAPEQRPLESGRQPTDSELGNGQRPAALQERRRAN